MAVFQIGQVKIHLIRLIRLIPIKLTRLINRPGVAVADLKTTP